MKRVFMLGLCFGIMLSVVAAGSLYIFSPTFVEELFKKENRQPSPKIIYSLAQEQGTTTPLTLVEIAPAIVRIRTRSDLASGVIIDPRGLVLTIAHFLGDSEIVYVGLGDSIQISGRVIAVDIKRDLALIELPDGTYPALPLGDSSDIVWGGRVVALGYALNFPGSPSASSGIISRIYTDHENKMDVLQTDAAINLGTSGGPLINQEGKVLGIILSFVSEYRSFSVNDVGFAVSIETIRNEFLNDISILDP